MRLAELFHSSAVHMPVLKKKDIPRLICVFDTYMYIVDPVGVFKRSKMMFCIVQVVNISIM